jgi:hypothetical protein
MKYYVDNLPQSVAGFFFTGKSEVGVGGSSVSVGGGSTTTAL